MTKVYAGAASLAAALMLGIAAHAAQAAGLGAPSDPSVASPVTKVQGQRETGGGGFGGGGGAGRSGGGGGVTSGGGRGGSLSGGGATSRSGGGSERGFVNRGGRSDGGSPGVSRRGGDRIGSSSRRHWDGDRGDRRGRHSYSRHRGGVGIFIGPGYGYYYGDYDDSCEWLRRRAIRTGSSYWWRRFRECVY